MRWAAFVLAAVLVLAAGMGDAQAPPVKLALVIGNADYDGGGIDVTPGGIAESTAGGYVPDLRNPINDATDIRDALARIGFKVDFVTDADGPTMSAALATFGTKVAEAPDSAQVVIYYAGHAMQVDGVNYLIPARARLPQVDFSRMPSRNAYGLIESVTVPIQRVVDQFREPRAPGVNLLILDACRDNPWDGRVRGLTRNTAPNAGGLAQVAAPTRTIVSFSTALNRKAQDGGERDRNSPFAAALKQNLAAPGTITEMLDGVGTLVEETTFGRQSPWYQSASVGKVCLAQCVAPPAPETRIVMVSPTPEPVKIPPNAPTKAGDVFEDCAGCPRMVVIPPGRFVMGIAPDVRHPVRDYAFMVSDEGPQRTVTIAQPFAMGQSEVTIAQYERCVNAEKCRDTPGYRVAGDPSTLPVSNLRKQDAERYIAWLNSEIGGALYRLPTEAEWEYAARALTNGARDDRYPWGPEASHENANYGKEGSNPGGRLSGRDRWEGVAPVRQFPANAFGLFDMHGNLEEMVADCVGSYPATPTDSSILNASATCERFITRGGHYYDSGFDIRSAARNSTLGKEGSQRERSPFTGFRLARTIDNRPPPP